VKPASKHLSYGMAIYYIYYWNLDY
jgi:hypothetical protein